MTFLKKFGEDAVVGLGWLAGFLYMRLCDFGNFMYDWTHHPDIRHSRAAAILLILIIFIVMSIL